MKVFHYGNGSWKDEGEAALTVVAVVGAVAAASLAGVAEKIEEMVILSGLGLVGGFCPYISPVCVIEE